MGKSPCEYARFSSAQDGLKHSVRSSLRLDDSLELQIARFVVVSIRMRLTRTFILAFAACLAVPEAIAQKQERSGAIQAATEATVLIKTHLKHGFLEDGQATGRWEGSGFLVDEEKGWILTNAHVAGYGPSGLRLKFDGQDYLIMRESDILAIV